ncbi:hypothetical protein MGSAQ_001035, partial [marine sediment metagenome]
FRVFSLISEPDSLMRVLIIESVLL